MGTIKNFKDLNAWQHSHSLALDVYKVTAKFPKSEIFGLTSQMRRCSVSVGSNIAEGFSRRTGKEKIQFYHMAQGSLSELQSQLLLAKDLNYIDSIGYSKLEELTITIQKLLNGLIKGVIKIHNS